MIFVKVYFLLIQIVELIKNGISLDNIETLTPVTCDKLGDDIESNIRYSRLRGFETCSVY